MTDPAEFETAKARNLILTQYFPEYTDRLNQTLQYAKTDPTSGLLKSRQILEDIANNVWRTSQNTPPPSTYDIFKNEEIRRDIPGRLLNRVHSLRSICNIGIHGHQVTKDDVLLSLNHLYVILEWYGSTHKELGELPTAVQPPHSFMRYVKDSINDRLFVFIIAMHIGIPAIVFRYHSKLPEELHRPFKYVYEGVFNYLAFSFSYSVALVFITTILAWIIFKRFRKQDLESRLLSYELMYTTVFGFQFLFLHLLDYYTRLF